jgi:predicted TIM-barrel fold metal-dependent hydrolase
MIIDCHTHVFPASVRDDPSLYRTRDATFRDLYATDKSRIATADDLVRAMDAAGVDMAVACAFGWYEHAACIQNNDAIIDAVQKYPDRLIGFFNVTPRDADATLTEVERCVRAGLRGVGEVRLANQEWDVEEKGGVQDILDAVEAHRLPILLHASEPVGHLYPGKAGATPDRVEAFLARRPNATVILAHWGGGLPFYALMPEVKKLLANVYVDSAASPFLYAPEVYKRVAEAIGIEKVLFASDYPLMPYKRAFAHLEAAGLSDEDREKALHRNAARLLGLPA